MINAVGRDIPEEILELTGKDIFRGTHHFDGVEFRTATHKVKPVINSGGSKLLPSIHEALAACGIRDGMTLSFHHHFRNGDKVLNMVLEECHRMGVRDLTIAASSLGSQNDPIVPYIEDGTITNIQSSGVRGGIGKAISEGKLRDSRSCVPMARVSVRLRRERPTLISRLSARRLRMSTAISGRMAARRTAVSFPIPQ